ncbi:transposase, partial [Pseudomonas spelaei]|uniref:transposase n=1 Tax=Pseudomonas spelaei TaxID=1055469 RepID=UPI003611106A
MSNQRYPEEFKIQAVKQVTEKQLPVSEVAARLGVSVHSLYGRGRDGSYLPPPAQIRTCGTTAY